MAKRLHKSPGCGRHHGGARPETAAETEERLRAANLRTGRALTAVPIVFFAGTIATQLSDAPETAIALLGLGGLLFVAQAIAGHLR